MKSEVEELHSLLLIDRSSDMFILKRSKCYGVLDSVFLPDSHFQKPSGYRFCILHCGIHSLLHDYCTVSGVESEHTPQNVVFFEIMEIFAFVY